MTAPTATATCQHCQHPIAIDPTDPDTWIATDAPQTPDEGDDFIWRDYCPDNHTERAVPHEPPPARICPGCESEGTHALGATDCSFDEAGNARPGHYATPAAVQAVLDLTERPTFPGPDYSANHG